jgi:peptidoglycan/LPS O-acetylase OafA/YrhL
MAGVLNRRELRYIAEISFALYVIHPLLAYTWLGGGEGWQKYLRRPLLFAALFGLAHVSTFQYERRWTVWAKRWSSGLSTRPQAGRAAVLPGDGPRAS